MGGTPELQNTGKRANLSLPFYYSNAKKGFSLRGEA